MAKEVELKKIELTVSANCCDGCRRKVKKALRGIEGVLKTEIDPVQPKVTVLGNVDARILIKKLQKVGKRAEIASSENQNVGNEKKEEETPLKEKEKAKPESEEKKRIDGDQSEQIKHQDSCGTKTNKKKESKAGGHAAEHEISQKNQNEMKTNSNVCIPEVIKNENPIPPQPVENYAATQPKIFYEAKNVRPHAQYSYVAEPYAVAMSCYAVPSYKLTPLPPPCYGHPCYHFERPVYQPPSQTPVTRVGDCFSDENSVGCHIM